MVVCQAATPDIHYCLSTHGRDCCQRLWGSCIGSHVGWTLHDIKCALNAHAIYHFYALFVYIPYRFCCILVNMVWDSYENIAVYVLGQAGAHAKQFVGLIVSSITMRMSAANIDPYLSRLLTRAPAMQGSDINKCGHGILSWRQNGWQAWSTFETGMLMRITPVEHAKADGGFLLAQRYAQRA